MADVSLGPLESYTCVGIILTCFTGLLELVFWKIPFNTRVYSNRYRYPKMLSFYNSLIWKTSCIASDQVNRNARKHCRDIEFMRTQFHDAFSALHKILQGSTERAQKHDLQTWHMSAEEKWNLKLYCQTLCIIITSLSSTH